MWYRRLFWQLFPAFLLVIALSFVAVMWFGIGWSSDLHQRLLLRDLVARANLVAPQAKALVLAGDSTTLQQYCVERGKRSATRITILAPDGAVLGDSDRDPATMENHKTDSRPEVLAALAGKPGEAIRYSTSVRQKMLYVGVPLTEHGKVVGVVRTSIPITYSDLEARARLIEPEVAALIESGRTADIDALCKARGKEAATRITVIMPDGSVVGDSEEAPARMDNHAKRPEIRAALAGSVGRSFRESGTLSQLMMYVGLPLVKGETSWASCAYRFRLRMVQPSAPR